MAVLISAADGENIADTETVNGEAANPGRGNVVLMWTASEIHDFEVEYSPDGGVRWYNPTLGSGQVDLLQTSVAAGNHTLIVPAFNVPHLRLILTCQEGLAGTCDFTADYFLDASRPWIW